MLNTKYLIIEYTAANADSLVEIWNHANKYMKINYKEVTDRVLRHKPSQGVLNVYLALDNDKVIGFCELSDSCSCNEEIALSLDHITVDQEYQGQGAGKMLILKCLERTVELGFARLDVTTSASNAENLYEKCGFTKSEWDLPGSHLINILPASGKAAIDKLRDQLNL